MTNATTIGWTPEPDSRGTLGLVWSCLATIFICVWSALHPNLPAENSRILDRMRYQAGYVALGLFAPEWLTLIALGDLEKARKVRHQVSAHFGTQMNFDSLTFPQFPEWSLKRCFFVIMGGFAMRNGAQQIRRVYFVDLLILFENKTVALPEIEDSDIDDLTQGDKLVKGIALIQIIWFVAQILGRLASGLAVTTVELFTVGNVLCAVITYLAWWNKPNGVRAPIVIEGVAPSFVEDHSWTPLSDSACLRQIKSGVIGLRSGLVGLLICLGFGILHLVAWKFYFASTTERVLWRVSSVGATVLSVILPLNGFWNLQMHSDRERRILKFSFFGLYALFRIYMFVEMFVGLRDVPVDVYETVQWTQYLPFLGGGCGVRYAPSALTEARVYRTLRFHIEC
jgi:hypothetical protein